MPVTNYHQQTYDDRDEQPRPPLGPCQGSQFGEQCPNQAERSFPSNRVYGETVRLCASCAMSR